MSDHVKIQFPYAGKGSMEAETLWAKRSSDGFVIDNIPFFVTGVALNDVFDAKPDADGFLRVDRLIHASGHSTIRLWFSKERLDYVPEVRQQLRSLGCPTELSDLDRLVAVDVPPTVDYRKTVKPYLEEHEKRGTFEYEEGCLGGAA